MHFISSLDYINVEWMSSGFQFSIIPSVWSDWVKTLLIAENYLEHSCIFHEAVTFSQEDDF